MKTALVPIEQHENLSAILETACLFAARFDTYLEGLPAWPTFASFVAVDPMGAAAIPPDTGDDEELVHKTRAEYEGFMQEHGVPRAGPKITGQSFGWADGEPASDGTVASHARIFDITIVGRPTSSSPSPRMSTLEAALFESGRPILIAPPTAPDHLGRSVMIAWNGSTETARAVAFSMPLLAKAERVVVLTVEGGTVPGPSGQALCDMLVANDIAAEETTVPPGNLAVGAAMLANAGSLGCDLVIKGAYTQSRVRQMIFGGATSHILWSTELPVFMAN
jgi:nucleotide-binding universal stress UspA family protein